MRVLQQFPRFAVCQHARWLISRALNSGVMRTNSHYFNRNKQLILTSAIGGTKRASTTLFDGSIFPITVEVDYARIFQLAKQK